MTQSAESQIESLKWAIGLLEQQLTAERAAHEETRRALDELFKQTAETTTQLSEAQAKLAEFEASFDLHWKASMRAIKMWQEAHPGNDLVWPNLTHLDVWLMEQLSEAREWQDDPHCFREAVGEAAGAVGYEGPWPPEDARVDIVRKLIEEHEQRGIQLSEAQAQCEHLKELNVTILDAHNDLEQSLAAKLSEAQAARERAEQLNEYFRDAVGECHVMISRNTSEYQIRKNWEPTDLPPRVQKVMRRAETAECELAAANERVSKIAAYAEDYRGELRSGFYHLRDMLREALTLATPAQEPAQEPPSTPHLRGKEYMDLMEKTAGRVEKWPAWKTGEGSARVE